VAAPIRFFVYGSMMAGEPEHQKLGGAPLVEEARTVAGYALVEVGPLGALVQEGTGSVGGEIYAIESGVIARLENDHPKLYRFESVDLEGGATAWTLLLDRELARGKRRVANGDWRGRFGARKPGELAPAGAFVTWARGRHGR
jgi:gamma-glutamylaminecyclotransferase